MTPDRWQQLKELFNDALERPPAERAAFLDAACADDAELRREVEALLAEHGAPASALDSLPGAIAAQMAEVGAQANNAGSAKMDGQMIGPYWLHERLDAGGMGEVYRADHTRLRRPAAIKLLRTQLAESQAANARFKREAKAVAVLAHPNIVVLYDYGEAAGVYYAVTELLDGATLRAQLNQGALPWQRALEIVAEIAAGLAATHAKGIIHCDLKPENIFITRDGYVKILDFGIARIQGTLNQDSLVTATQAASMAASVADELRTAPGMIIGTARYMSPEQALGQELDQRTDLFSLGVVFYELLTGVPPFKGDSTAALVDAIVHHEPLYQRVLALFERQLAAGDQSAAYEIAINLNNLAALYARTNRRAEAEPLYRRALAIKERLLGAQHPDVAVTLNNLGVLLKALSRIEEAVEMYRRALAIFEATLAAGHPKLEAARANYERLQK
ncbi:MAG: serine/threonine protein kinase [Acidobacteria bacterium]|nr:serine/threonine protein kinase [Acidobacteriota bacterium]